MILPPRPVAFMNWVWDSFSESRSPAIIDDPDAPRIDWGEDEPSTADTEARD